MKTMINLFFIISLSFFLTACGKSEGGENSNGNNVVTPVATSAINVHDANNQYLGILLDIGGPNGFALDYGGAPPRIFMKFFSPTLGKITLINLHTTGTYLAGEITNARIYYTESECSGSAFLRGSFDALRCSQNKCFVSSSISPSSIPVIFNSRLSNDGCTNIPLIFSTDTDFFKATRIPVSDIPFTLPVAFPLRYDTGQQ
jgi:hypothetical protein